MRPIRHWNERRVAAHIFLSIPACLVLAVLRHLACQIGLDVGVEALRKMLQRVRRVVGLVCVGEVVTPFVTPSGLTEEARRLLERIGVPQGQDRTYGAEAVRGGNGPVPLPIAQVCQGQLLGWPGETLAEVVPNV